MNLISAQLSPDSAERQMNRVFIPLHLWFRNQYLAPRTSMTKNLVGLLRKLE